ncbi:MAG: hypothetical protein ACE5HO_09030 [bacterium]
MNDAGLFSQWYLSLAIAGGVVLIAAGLLVAVWLAARRILNQASAALELVTQIKNNTRSIWSLQETNATATKILDAAQSIKNHGAQVAEALHAANKEKV